MNARARDLLGSILMLVFVAVLWMQRNYITPFGGIFPDIVMICLAAVAVLTLIMAFTPWAAIKEAAVKKQDALRKNWFEMAVVGIIMLVWTVLLRYAGFALSGVLGFGGIAWFLSSRRGSLRTILTTFIAGAVLTYLLIFIFEHLLQVPLPKGTIFG